MSTTPPPYGSGPPGAGPPGPWTGPPPGARPPGLSNTARFWIGTPVGAVGLPAYVLGVVILVGALSSGLSGDAVVGVLGGIGAVSLVLVVVGLVVRATRFFVLGFVAGGAVTVIVLAGACVALLRGLGAA